MCQATIWGLEAAETMLNPGVVTIYLSPFVLCLSGVLIPSSQSKLQARPKKSIVFLCLENLKFAELKFGKCLILSGCFKICQVPYST